MVLVVLPLRKRSACIVEWSIREDLQDAGGFCVFWDRRQRMSREMHLRAVLDLKRRLKLYQG